MTAKLLKTCNMCGNPLESDEWICCPYCATRVKAVEKTPLAELIKHMNTGSRLNKASSADKTTFGEEKPVAGNHPRLVPTGLNKDKPVVLKDDLITLGRSDLVKAYLSDKSVSRLHAVIVCYKSDIFIADCGSSFHTLINGTRLSPCVLKAGDIITFGKAEYKLEIPDATTGQ